MSEQDLLLNDLEKFLSTSFGDAIVWEQRDADLVGKYIYLKYEGAELGVFVGYYGDNASSKTCVTFFFAHPASTGEVRKDTWRILHRILIRLNLRLKSNAYRLVAGKSPAIIRTKNFADSTFSKASAEQFFNESVEIIRKCEPVYRAKKSR